MYKKCGYLCTLERGLSLLLCATSPRVIRWCIPPATTRRRHSRLWLLPITLLLLWLRGPVDESYMVSHNIKR